MIMPTKISMVRSCTSQKLIRKNYTIIKIYKNDFSLVNSFSWFHIRLFNIPTYIFTAVSIYLSFNHHRGANNHKNTRKINKFYIFKQRSFFSGNLVVNWKLGGVTGTTSAGCGSGSAPKRTRHIFRVAARRLTIRSNPNKWSSQAPGMCSLMNLASLKTYSALWPDGPLVEITWWAIDSKVASPSQWQFPGNATYTTVEIGGSVPVG